MQETANVTAEKPAIIPLKIDHSVYMVLPLPSFGCLEVHKRLGQENQL